MSHHVSVHLKWLLNPRWQQTAWPPLRMPLHLSTSDRHGRKMNCLCLHLTRALWRRTEQCVFARVAGVCGQFNLPQLRFPLAQICQPEKKVFPLSVEVTRVTFLGGKIAGVKKKKNQQCLQWETTLTHNCAYQNKLLSVRHMISLRAWACAYMLMIADFVL